MGCCCANSHRAQARSRACDRGCVPGIDSPHVTAIASQPPTQDVPACVLVPCYHNVLDIQTSTTGRRGRWLALRITTVPGIALAHANIQRKQRIHVRAVAVYGFSCRRGLFANPYKELYAPLQQRLEAHLKEERSDVQNYVL